MKYHKKIMLSVIDEFGNFPKGDSIVHTVPATDTKKYIDTINFKVLNEGSSNSDVEIIYDYSDPIPGIKSYHRLAPKELKNIKVSIHSSTDPQNIYVVGPSTIYILGHVDRIEENL
jgi:hypothetical protein